ncbi:MAG: hypothetical protein FWG68_12710 [Defluviitaleaceae bacterium]|nr:hypothetical protein [Defluviitaleaceae bacterium]
MKNKLAKNLTSCSLCVIMLFSHLANFSQVEVFAHESDLLPPLITEIEYNPYATGGRIRDINTEETLIFNTLALAYETEDEFEWLMPNRRTPGVDFEVFETQPYVDLPWAGRVHILADGSLYVAGYLEEELAEALPALEEYLRDSQLEETIQRFNIPQPRGLARSTSVTATVRNQTMLNVADYSRTGFQGTWRFSVGTAFVDGEICDIVCIDHNVPQFPLNGTSFQIDFGSSEGIGGLSAAAINFIFQNSPTLGEASIITAYLNGTTNTNLTTAQQRLLDDARLLDAETVALLVGDLYMDLPEYFYEDVYFFEEFEPNVRFYREDLREGAALARLGAMHWNARAAHSIVPRVGGRGIAVYPASQSSTTPNEWGTFVSEPFHINGWGPNLSVDIIGGTPGNNAFIMSASLGTAIGGIDTLSDDQLMDLFDGGFLIAGHPQEGDCTEHEVTVRVGMDMPNMQPGQKGITGGGIQNVWVSCPEPAISMEDVERVYTEFTFTFGGECDTKDPETVYPTDISNEDCVSEISPVTISWEEYGNQFTSDTGLECTEEGAVASWQAWARSEGESQLQQAISEIDFENKTPPEDCTEEKPEPEDCSPEPFEECGEWECYDFDREDNYDDQDRGEVGPVGDPIEIPLRWNNIPFAFAETHMATDGFTRKNLLPKI